MQNKKIVQQENIQVYLNMKKKIEEIGYEKQDKNYYIFMKINCLLSVNFF